MEDQDLVEVLTMRTAQEIGIPTASVSLAEFEDLRCIVVNRFDRILNQTNHWIRVHQEDMCQASGTLPMLKYEAQQGPTAVKIAKLIADSSSNAGLDNQRFAQALIFNWLVCGTDAHARNYSFLLAGRSVRLAPLYDLNSHLAYANGATSDLSMSLNGNFKAALLTSSMWIDIAKSLYVDPTWLSAEIDRQRELIPKAMVSCAANNEIAQHDSAVIDRLINQTKSWISHRR